MITQDSMSIETAMQLKLEIETVLTSYCENEYDKGLIDISTILEFMAILSLHILTSMRSGIPLINISMNGHDLVVSEEYVNWLNTNKKSAA